MQNDEGFNAPSRCDWTEYWIISNGFKVIHCLEEPVGIIEQRLNPVLRATLLHFHQKLFLMFLLLKFLTFWKHGKISLFKMPIADYFNRLNLLLPPGHLEKALIRLVRKHAVIMQSHEIRDSMQCNLISLLLIAVIWSHRPG